MTHSELQAVAAEIAADGLNLVFGKESGFGLVDASILHITGPAKTEVRLWDEGGGDFFIEIGEERLVAAWWRQDAKRASLARVVRAILDGTFAVAKGRVTVTVDGKGVMLRDQI